MLPCRHEFPYLNALVVLRLSQAAEAVAHPGVTSPGSGTALSWRAWHDKRHIVGHHRKRSVRSPVLIVS